MGLRINEKRVKYDNKIRDFTIDLHELCEKHEMTEFDLNLAISEILYKGLQSRVKNKVGKSYKY